MRVVTSWPLSSSNPHTTPADETLHVMKLNWSSWCADWLTALHLTLSATTPARATTHRLVRLQPDLSLHQWRFPPHKLTGRLFYFVSLLCGLVWVYNSAVPLTDCTGRVEARPERKPPLWWGWHCSGLAPAWCGVPVGREPSYRQLRHHHQSHQSSSTSVWHTLMS